MANLRPLLDYSRFGYGRTGNAMYTGNQFQDLEEIGQDHPDWARGINERFLSRDNGEGSTQQLVRYLPKPGSYLRDAFDKYPGLITSGETQLGGDRQYLHEIDYSKLPTSRGISAERLLPYESYNRVKDRNFTWNDPNYGQVTHSANAKGRDWLGPLLLSILGGGLTLGLGMPGLAMSGVRAASTIGRGNHMGGALSILPALMRGVGGGG